MSQASFCRRVWGRVGRQFAQTARSSGAAGKAAGAGVRLLRAEGNVETVLCLVPVRTDSAWFHKTLTWRRKSISCRAGFKFVDLNGKQQPTPFSLMVVALSASIEQKRRFANLMPGRWWPKAG